MAGSDVEVIEGRLLEAPTSDATGLDRRAFGEFVGPQGELASYAFGWTTGRGERVGSLSIGIGAGNPGGATIHATVFEHDGSYAFALTDDPFEDVPEGGPDLTAEQARNHQDLPFVWWVADTAFARDRRAWWLRHWIVGTSSLQTRQVFEGSEPVLLVVHDEDGEWQLIGSSKAGYDGHLSHLTHRIDEDITLLDVLDLAPGERAERGGVGGRWTRSRRA